MSSPASTVRRYAPRLPPQQRREQILDAALHLMADGGFEQVTMAAVARTAGISKPVVYELYTDRSALLKALLDREDARALADIARFLPESLPDESPDLTLVANIRSFLEAVLARPDAWRIFLVHPDATPPEVRERIAQRRCDILAQAQFLIGQSLARQGGPSIDPELFAHAIVAIAEEGARLALADPRRYTIERLTRFTADLVAALGLGAPNPERNP